MVRGAFLLARFDVHPAILDFPLHCIAHENMIDPETPIAPKGSGSVIPPGITALGLFKFPKCIAQLEIQQTLEGLPLERAAENLLPPALRVVNIPVLGCDIEITQDDELGAKVSFRGQKVTDLLQPVEFILVLFRADLTPVGNVEVYDADVADRRCDDTPLRVNQVRRIRYAIAQRAAAQQRDPVVGLLAIAECVVASRCKRAGREFCIRYFRFLQRQDVRPLDLKPGEHLWQADTQGIDIPARYLQGDRITDGNSAPSGCTGARDKTPEILSDELGVQADSQGQVDCPQILGQVSDRNEIDARFGQFADAVEGDIA